MQLIAPLITPRVLELARARLCGMDLVKGKKVFCVPDAPHVVKLALLIVLEMNPHERFTVMEEGIMRGMDADNVNPYKREGLIRAF
jgi:hypothetical protein